MDFERISRAWGFIQLGSSLLLSLTLVTILAIYGLSNTPLIINIVIGIWIFNEIYSVFCCIVLFKALKQREVKVFYIWFCTEAIYVTIKFILLTIIVFQKISLTGSLALVAVNAVFHISFFLVVMIYRKHISVTFYDPSVHRIHDL